MRLYTALVLHPRIVRAVSERVVSSPSSVRTQGPVGRVRRLASVFGDRQAAGTAYGRRP